MATLPGHLFQAYRQYKSDTGTIAGWLAETSTNCGYEPENKRPDQKAPPRLRGKAPSRRPKVTVPADLSESFTRAVTARRWCTEWFSSHTLNRDSDNRHSHFTGVLEASFRSLLSLIDTPKVAPREQRSARQKSPEVEVESSTNIFEHLTVEDTLEDSAESGLDPSQAAQSGPPRPLPYAVIEQDKEGIMDDFLFAIYCYLTDLHELQEYLKGLWKSYKEGASELLVVSLITNTAIDLVRMSEYELEFNIKRPEEYPIAKFPTWTLPAVLYFQLVPEDSDLSVQEVVMPWSCPPLQYVNFTKKEEFTFWTIYSLFKTFVPPNAADRRRHGAFRILDLENMFREGGEDPKYVRLAAFLPEICSVASASERSFAEDEFTRGFRHLITKYEILIWFTFAAQVFMDIQSMLAETLQESYHDIQEVVGQAVEAHQIYCSYVEALPNNIKRSKHHEPLCKAIRNTYNLVLEDRIGKMQAERASASLKNSAVKLKGTDYFLGSHPLRCGLIKYDLYLQRHWRGLLIANASADIVCMAHLYAACRLLRPESAPWPDMELLIARQTREHLFIGGQPKTLAESEVKFRLFLGQPPQALAKNRRTSHIPWNPKKARVLKNQSIISEAFLERMCGYNEKADPSTASLQKTLMDPTFWQRLPLKKEHIDNAIPDNQTKGVPYTAIETCERMRLALTNDMADFCFDWLSMQRTCEVIMRALGMATDANHPGFETAQTAPQARGLSVLFEASLAEELHPHVPQADLATKRDLLPLLSRTNDLIQSVVRRGDGDKEIQKLRIISKGTDYGCYLWELKELALLYGGEEHVPKDLCT
ncbi:hypothetical protein BU16DRAFT_556443 [Lophium mytilinum]|uniref:DUF6604 domain-containing protein n=1 Tax=Lophium mytilinum TaxID=390894 RepID=A0A6A6R7X4_9PEZI|nr:hypothetical protein BU16DRAFT_556443 [Lophium mytilinum]